MIETTQSEPRKSGRSPSAETPPFDALSPATLLFLDNPNHGRREIPRLLRRWNPHWHIEAAVELDDAQLLDEHRFDAIVASDTKTAQTVADVFGQSHSFRELLDCETLDGSLKGLSSSPLNAFDRLKAQLAKAKFYEQILQHDGMLELAAEFMNLQSSPSIYNEVLNRLEATDSTMAEVGELIGRHDDMSTLLIRKANSAVCAQDRRIKSPLHAASLLGMETIRTFLASTALTQQTGTADTILQHSLRVALIARGIARHEDCSGDERDAAFAAGLLHDIGKAALREAFPDEYQQAVQCAVDEKRSQADVEVDVFGASHDLIGAELLSLWGSPAAVVRAVALSHQTIEQEDKLAAYVAAANIASHLRSQKEKSRQRQLERQGLQSQFNRWHAAGLFSSSRARAAD